MMSKAWMVHKTNEMTWAHVDKDLPEEAKKRHAEELELVRGIVFGDPALVEDLEKQRQAEKILDDLCLWYHIWVD